MPALPVPILDHVVVNVRDAIDAAQERYRRLGFTLTPRGYHTLGSVNHLAVFGTEYLELIAAPAGETRRMEILEAPAGLNGIVFGTEDSTSVHAALRESGVPAEPPNEFSRPVELPDRTRRDAVFRTVRLPQTLIEGGRLYFCHHFTRDLVWRDDWRRHPNGVVGVARAIIAAQEPEKLATYFRGMFGDESVRAQQGGAEVLLGNTTIAIVPPERLSAEFGAAAPDGDGRHCYMAALTLRCSSLDRAARTLSAGGVPASNWVNRLLVGAGDAFGVALEFAE